MSTAFPTEIWIMISCDVLGTYVHTLVLRPPNSRCWHGYHVLRSVSRHFKAIADDIWRSALESEETWGREIGKLRTAIFTGKYDGPDDWGAPPLILAYGAYILSLIVEDNPHANVENATKAYRASLKVLGKDSFPIKWLDLASTFNYNVKPRQFRQYLDSSIYATEIQSHKDRLSRVLKQTLNLVRASDGSEEITSRLEGFLANFEEIYLFVASTRPRLDHTVFMTLKELVRKFPASDGAGEAQTPLSISRRKLAARVASFTEAWSKEYESIKSRRIAMHRAVNYGVRRPDALLEHHAIDSVGGRALRI